MKKHAYIIIANSVSTVLLTCIEMLDDPLNDIFILFDKKSQLMPRANELIKLARHSHISFYEQIVNWGGYSQISAELTLIEAVLNESEDYSYIHFFQGSDLPIKSKEQIRVFFNRNSGKEFISVESDRKKMAENKCYYYHFFCHNRYFRKNRIVKGLNFGIVAIQKIFHMRHNTDIEVYQGSALFSITPIFAKYLIDCKYEIKHRFRFALAADECFIQTIAMNSPFKDQLFIGANGNPTNARLIDRSRPDGKNSPHIWRDDEFDNIISQPKEFCFARKFDSLIAPQIIKRLRDYLN